nr:putative oxidoreductase [Quercus suber]
MSSSTWSPANLPDLTGKVFLVTGGNTGLGRITIEHLISRNATVWMGARSESKASAARAELISHHPHAKITHLPIDQMNLKSVAAAADTVLQAGGKLHGLVNNAGIMATPYAISDDGFEAQWQSTARADGPGSVRVVCVTSVGHRFYTRKAGIDYDDINQTKGSAYGRYSQSKLGNILHANELAVRYGPIDKSVPRPDGEIWAASCHPGNYDTSVRSQLSLICTDLGAEANTSHRQLTQQGGYVVAMIKLVLKLLGVINMNMDVGSHNSLFIAASKEFSGEMNGEYFVPVARTGNGTKPAQDKEHAVKLWDWTLSELQKRTLI